MEVARQDVLNNADFCLLIANPTHTGAYWLSTLHSPADLIIRLKLINLGIFVEFYGISTLNTDTSVSHSSAAKIVLKF